MATAATTMTTAELLAMPDDGIDRWLINGELREREMPVRNRFHSETMSKVAQHLSNWRDSQPQPRGKVLTGDAGVRLPGEPETTFGIDIVYITTDVLANQPPDTTIVEGVPTLAVEILSPSDTQEDINEKVDALLAAGVSLVWLIDPHARTVVVRRPDAAPRMFNEQEEMTAEPHLAGFRVAVARLFE
jgi:Uma2 family endonuclease